MQKTGVLGTVVNMVYAESETNQLSGWIEVDGNHYKANEPITTSYAELERMKRQGIEEIMNKIQSLAKKVPKENASFNKHKAI